MGSQAAGVSAVLCGVRAQARVRSILSSAFIGLMFAGAVACSSAARAEDSSEQPSTQQDVPKNERYVIDFDAHPPAIAVISHDRAVVQGAVLTAQGRRDSGHTYTIEIGLRGGPASAREGTAQSSLAGRGPTSFAGNEPLRLVRRDDGRSALEIAVRGLAGSPTGPDGKGLVYYRDASSRTDVALSIDGGHYLTDVAMTITNIDSCIGGAQTETCNGDFIDRVSMPDHPGSESLVPSDGHQHVVLANRATPAFGDSDNSGRADAGYDHSRPFESTGGDVEIRVAGLAGDTFQLTVDDPGFGIDGGDETHAFDATAQIFGIGSEISFALEDAPPSHDGGVISGSVFDDRNGDGVRGSDEPGIDGIDVTVHHAGEAFQQPLQTVVSQSIGDDSGAFVFESLKLDDLYRVEARISHAPDLSPIRLVRHIRAASTASAQADIAVSIESESPQVVDSPTLRNRGYLLPDLVPLAVSPQGTELRGTALEDFERSYPGLDRWYLDTTTQPGSILLRFGTFAANQGDGPLHVVRSGDSGGSVVQRMYRPDGSFADVEVGEFVHHPSHDHVHVADFELYELIDVATNDVVASSPKVSFCLTDVLDPVDPDRLVQAPVWLTPRGWDCEATEQGINVGYSDYYGPALPDQWIDVTAVPDGDYMLRVTVNPDLNLFELDTSNNQVQVELTLDNPLSSAGSSG